MAFAINVGVGENIRLMSKIKSNLLVKTRSWGSK